MVNKYYIIPDNIDYYPYITNIILPLKYNRSNNCLLILPNVFATKMLESTVSRTVDLCSFGQINTALSKIEAKTLMLKIIIHYEQKLSYNLNEALHSAQQLVELYDELTRKNLDIAVVTNYINHDFAAHWHRTAEFLKYVFNAYQQASASHRTAVITKHYNDIFICGVENIMDYSHVIESLRNKCTSLHIFFPKLSIFNKSIIINKFPVESVYDDSSQETNVMPQSQSGIECRKKSNVDIQTYNTAPISAEKIKAIIQEIHDNKKSQYLLSSNIVSMTYDVAQCIKDEIQDGIHKKFAIITNDYLFSELLMTSISDIDNILSYTTFTYKLLSTHVADLFMKIIKFHMSGDIQDLVYLLQSQLITNKLFPKNIRPLQQPTDDEEAPSKIDLCKSSSIYNILISEYITNTNKHDDVYEILNKIISIFAEESLEQSIVRLIYQLHDIKTHAHFHEILNIHLDIFRTLLNYLRYDNTLFFAEKEFFESLQNLTEVHILSSLGIHHTNYIIFMEKHLAEISLPLESFDTSKTFDKSMLFILKPQEAALHSFDVAIMCDVDSWSEKIANTPWLCEKAKRTFGLPNDYDNQMQSMCYFNTIAKNCKKHYVIRPIMRNGQETKKCFFLKL